MKLNWGLSIGIVYSLFAIAMILFAVKASNQKYDLVNDNYYEEAVNFQKKIDAGNNATNARSKLEIEYIKESNSIKIAYGKDVNYTSGSILFYKPDKATDDFTLQFTTDKTGSLMLPLKKMAHGYWKINTSWKSNGKDCYEENKIYIP